MNEEPSQPGQMSSERNRTSREGGLDKFEKREAYLTLPSLCVYILLEQTEAAGLVYRRTQGDEFEREFYFGFDAIISLPKIDCELRLEHVYEGVEFPPGKNAETEAG